MKQKTKVQKGITLIALIITIVVLLILAAVAIANITNDGVLSYAENAAIQYNQAVKNEKDILQGYVDYLNKHNGGFGSGNGEGSGTVLAIANKIQESNIKVVDEFGNQIVVPAGFKIRVDDDEGIKGDEKSIATNVTQGIVIEDENGNQFVWVPVGTIYTNAQKTESKTITLGRYSNFVPDENGVYTPIQTIENYETEVNISEDEFIVENTTENHNSEEYENAIARNIGDFIESVDENGGYYIGRFEAGNVNKLLVCKTGQAVYQISQKEASSLSKNMYNDGYKTGTFSSDMVNSYAWDTAIIFIQTFEEDGRSYYRMNKSGEFTSTGGNKDEYCNINDMSGNAEEWSTETSGSITHPCVFRGGCYNSGDDCTDFYTSFRHGNTPSGSAANAGSFRPLLYLAL